MEGVPNEKVQMFSCQHVPNGIEFFSYKVYLRLIKVISLMYVNYIDIGPLLLARTFTKFEN